ncbi:MAG TPA: leucyl aminopeptidase [Polyangiaceae bacterium]|nr:leucyl aminopeptidase [Polyangiaceae bacterium]
MTASIEIGSGDPTRAALEVLAVCVEEGSLERNAWLEPIEAAVGGGLIAHAKLVEFTGKADQLLDVSTLGRTKARRIVLVGLGPRQKLDAARLRSAIATAVRAANGPGVTRVGVALPPDVDWRNVGEAAGLGSYRFLKYFTGDRRPKAELKKIFLFAQGRVGASARRELALGVGIAEAVALARDAVNEPPNVLTPEALASIARRIAKSGKLGVKVLDKRGIRAAGMHLHYAVGQGSANEPRFIHLSYAPRGATKRLVFVGKGLTFDSGGLCIKPAPGMGEMKTDMAGAAAVLGLMAAVARLKPRVEVHGIVGAAENMPDGDAYRPADVFTSLSGKTVEVINTDAEGRLVLADALAYAARLEPDLVVDVATLTGAALIALGKTCSPYYATSDDVAQKFEGAARDAGESFWRLPLLDELAEQLKSDIADFKHTGDRYGGSILAALFLREFVGGYPWIHCDVAGPVYAERARGIYPKGATGHPVLTFVNLVEGFAR